MERGPVVIDKTCRCQHTRMLAQAETARRPAHVRAHPSALVGRKIYNLDARCVCVCVCVRARAPVPGCILDTRALAATTLGSATAMP